jgi:hypothetical protein
MTLDGNSAFKPTAFFGSDGPTWDDRTVYLKEAQGTANPKNSLTAGTDCLAWAYSAVTSG